MKALLSTTYFGPVQWYQKLHRYDEVEIEQWESFQKQTYRNRCLIATTQGVQALTVPVERNREEFTVDGLQFTDDYSAAEGLRAERLAAEGLGAETGLAGISTVNRKLSTVNKIRISDHGNWRHLHWNALVSAYGESPFFEYYQDDIRPFFEKKWEYLFDFNEAIREKMCELLDIEAKVSFSSQFTVYSLQFTDDYSAAEGFGAEGLSAEGLCTEGLAAEAGLAGISTVNCKPSTVNKIIDYREMIRPKHPMADPDFEPKPYYQVYQQKHGFLPNLSVLDLLFNMGPEGIFYL